MVSDVSLEPTLAGRHVVVVAPSVSLGAQTYLRAKIRGLIDHGARVTVVERKSSLWRAWTHQHTPLPRARVIAATSAHPDALQPLTIALLLLANPRTTAWAIRRSIRFARFPRKALKALVGLVELRRLEPDIVVFAFSSVAINYRPALQAGLGVPTSTSCRGSAELVKATVDPRRAAKLDDTLELVDAVHCVSDHMRDFVVDLGCDASKVFVNRPAVDTAYFVPRGTEDGHEGPLRIVSVGRLSWVKANEVALIAVDELRRSGHDVELRIIGDGEEWEKLVWLRSALGLEQHVSLLGWREPEAILEELRRADAFLSTSASEGISNAALEAMACGLPVVTTDAGGMREAVVDGVTGFVVPQRCPTAVADAIRHLAEDPGRRRELGRAARSHAVCHYDLTDQAARFARVYGQIAS